MEIPIKINNREVTVPEGSTILEAAEKLNINIPTLCYLNGYERFTSCMICVVHEINSNRLVPSCSMTVEQGMEIETDNEKVREARKDTLDFLLSEHIGDCEAPCRRACPANMNIPLMIRQIKEKKFADAIITVKKDIALPAVLGRICPAPCEKACNRKSYDNPVSICYLKRFVADIDLALNSPYRPEIKKKTGKKVAVVGAGPTGLSAAYYLIQEGHECFIYDQNPQPGGMLRYGVPDEKLPKQVLDRELEQIFALGVKFYPGHLLGKDIHLEKLRNKYDAVVLAIGTIKPEIFENSGIELSPRGIVVNKKTFETSMPDVFAGGNAVSEARMAIRALAHGKGISYSVNQFLLISCKGLHKKQAFEMRPPKERHQADREWVGGATPFLKNLPITGSPRRFDSRIGKLSEDEVEEFLPPAARGAFLKNRPPEPPEKLFISKGLICITPLIHRFSSPLSRLHQYYR